MKPILNVVRLSGLTIFQQLKIEEALLRTNTENWCIVQDGVPPSIVMGISGVPEEHLNLSLLQSAPVPVIKRFSGGGTVFVDPHTAFVSFIFQSQAIQVPANPDQVFCWSNRFYQHVFRDHPFSLKERDYVFHDRKFAGNAQYMRKNRWLHHSTFLWDYDPKNMDYLLLPTRRPDYRKDRSHTDFLCRLSNYLPTKQDFWNRLEKALQTHFTLQEKFDHQIIPFLDLPHRQATIEYPLINRPF